jgi:hypothetical protein
MTSAYPTVFNCSICNKPVDLETAKTDENGKTVHEECYVFKQTLKPAVIKPGKVQDLTRL